VYKDIQGSSNMTGTDLCVINEVADLPGTGFEYSFIFMSMLSKPAPFNFCVIPVGVSL